MNKENRGEKALKNFFVGSCNEIVTLLCGLILPRLILTNFGSAYNGITHSITQFISYIELMKSGIGGATRAALYKPLADRDTIAISKVVATTQKFMRKITFYFIFFIIIFAIIYPSFINKEFSWTFSFTLILIISLSSFAEYYFGFTYQMLLIADQKSRIIGRLRIFTTILNTIVSVILINNFFSIHIIKLANVLISSIIPIFLYIYVNKKYMIVKKIDSSIDVLPQKWDATAHEVASFVNNNTDIVILTLFTNLLEVSVYTVYHYVISNLKRIVSTFTSSFAGAFGNMYANNEIKLMNENLGIYELIVFSLTSILYSVALVMIVPFALLYTSGVTDVDYNRPLFGIIIIFAGVFDCFRTPYKTIVTAAGHFKQTKKGAIVEATLNITISILMVKKYGIIGVAIGTLCAMIFRTIQYALYLSKNIINRSIKHFILHVFSSLLIIIMVAFISKLYVSNINNWLDWIAYAFVTTAISILFTLFINVILFRKDVILFINKLKNIILKYNN